MHQKRVLVKQMAETAKKQNSSYICVTNTNLKPNILSIRENYSNFEKRIRKISFQIKIKIKPAKGKKMKEITRLRLKKIKICLRVELRCKIEKDNKIRSCEL